MADFGRNFIDMFGNQAVKDLTAEVNRRLNAHSDPRRSVGEVLYGLSPDKSAVGFEEVGSAWIRHSNDFGDTSQLCFTSGTEIPEKLENHLVWFYSKVDPNVVLRNKYDTEDGDFVGVRFKIVRGSKIFTIHKRKVIDGFVVYEKNEDTDDNEITWEDFWDIQYDLVKEARAEFVAQFPFTDKYVDLR